MFALLAAPAGALAQPPEDPEVWIATPSEWPEVAHETADDRCRSITALLARLGAEPDTVALRGRAWLTERGCRHRTFEGDASAPASARGSWARVVAGVRAILRERPAAIARRHLARERRDLVARRRAARRVRVTPGPIEWALTVGFRLDEHGTVHVSVTREAAQPLDVRTRERTCAPCRAPGPCPCAERTDRSSETIRWRDRAYAQVPVDGAPIVVRTGDEGT